MSEDFSNKSVLVWDTGNQTLMARRLAEFFGRVYYYKEWQIGFPTILDVVVGSGYEKVERVKEVWSIVPKVDLIVFPDCMNGDLQVYLESQGKRVWGSRMGAQLELNRWKTKELLKSVGLPVQPCQRVIGIEKLREIVKSREEIYVKISTFRGDMESFPGKGKIITEPRLDELAFRLGSAKNDVVFIVEDKIETDIEVGYDGICVHGKWPKMAMQGYEIKDACYLGAAMPYDKLPEQVREVNEGIQNFLKETRYANNLSTEIRVLNDLPYAIDFTCRNPCPGGEVQILNTKNLASVLYHGAVGDLDDPDYEYKFAAEAMIYSDWGHRHWSNLKTTTDREQFITLFNSMNIDANHEAVIPTVTELAVLTNEIGAVVGLGNTIEEAIKHLKENAEGIEGIDIEVRIDSLGKAIEEIEKAQKAGLPFSDTPLPKPEDVL